MNPLYEVAVYVLLFVFWTLVFFKPGLLKLIICWPLEFVLQVPFARPGFVFGTQVEFRDRDRKVKRGYVDALSLTGRFVLVSDPSGQTQDWIRQSRIVATHRAGA